MSRQRSYRPYEFDDNYRKKQSVRSEMSLLEEENAILKLKCKKVSELEDKVEMVLKQNQQLLSENQKMARVLHQQKSEYQILKNKCDTYHSQRLAMAEDYETERKRLITQLQLLQDKLADTEAAHIAKMNEFKKQLNYDMQTIKRQSAASAEAYEKDIRRLKVQVERRERDLDQYNVKLQRLAADSDYEILKLTQEKQKFKNDLALQSQDHVNDIQNLKAKLETTYLSELESVKRSHLSQLQELQFENNQVKKMVEERELEIEEMTSKFNKMKRNNEDTINYLKKELENCRSKVIEAQQKGELQIGNLKQNLSLLHEAEIEEIMGKQQIQCRALEDEIASLQNMIHSKSLEIEQLLKEKVNTRAVFDADIARLKEDYALLQQKYKDLEIKFNEVSGQAANRLTDREKHLQYLENVIKTQKENNDLELTGLQTVIENLKQELLNAKRLHKDEAQSLKQEISGLKNELNRTVAEAEEQQHKLEKRISQLQNQLYGTTTNLNNKRQALENRIRMIEKENQGLKNNLVLREKQIRQLQERLKVSAERESKLEKEIDDLRNKIVKKEQKSNCSINDQKNRLEASFNFAIQNLKSDHETALRVEAGKYKDLMEKYKKKETELEQLLKRYKKMTDEIQILTEQEANKKEITLKYPGATADLVATKNLFDVYLKTKVLDVCGDALKENMTK